MIIVEGPDGTGKSTLIAKLSEDLDIPKHERAVRDRLGPSDLQGQSLWQWAYHDVTTWPSQALAIYDRHPLVSEYIYGPVIRGASAPGFNQPTAQGLRRKMEQQCLLVLCIPPHEVYIANLKLEEQMEGVDEHAVQLYGLYEALVSSWGGWRVLYDFTEGEAYEHVKMSVRLHAAQWKNNLRFRAS
jgi:hypothetical protein